MTSFNQFPPEVLAAILGITDVLGAAVLKLWQCGDQTLHQKLRQGGCDALSLVDTRPKQYNALPQLLLTGTFTQLHRLQIKTKLPLPNLGEVLCDIGSSLRILSIECAQLNNAIQGLDYANQWPQLNSLSLKSSIVNDTIGVCNFLSRLPPTLTSLTCSQALIGGDDTMPLVIVLGQLPRELLHLEYLTNHQTGYILQDVDEPALLKALPPNIKTLYIGKNFDHKPQCYSLTSAENAGLLPQSLKHLGVTYYNEQVFALPSKLKKLAMRFDIISSNVWLRLVSPRAPTRLPHNLKTLIIDLPMRRHETSQAFFPPDIWRQFLPSRLSTFSCAVPLPLQWDKMSRDVCVWPATLKSINLHLTYAKHLGLLSLPRSIQNVDVSVKYGNMNASDAFKGLLTQTQHPHLVQLCLNFQLENIVIAQLPRSITHLDLQHDTAPKQYHEQDYRPLSALAELYLPTDRLSLEAHQRLYLPASLTCLCSQNDVANVLPLDKTQRLIQSLPRGLQILEWSNIMSINVDLVKQLPPNLSKLSGIVELSDDEATNMIQALPRSLKELSLRSPYFSSRMLIDGSCLGTLLPPRLKTLRLYEYLMEKINFDQSPLPSLEWVGISVQPEYNLQHAQIMALFPNANCRIY